MSKDGHRAYGLVSKSDIDRMSSMCAPMNEMAALAEPRPSQARLDKAFRHKLAAAT